MKNSWKQSDFKYSGKEFIEETGTNDLGWRQQDPVLGRMWASDRFAEKYYGLSNYQFAANNSISNIDVNGDSLMIFKNGVYTITVDNGKNEITGYNQRSFRDKSGNEIFTGGQSFVFNDYEDDMKEIKSGALKLRFVNDSEISNIMTESGVMDKSSRDNAWSYIERESRPIGSDARLSDFKSTGRMDYQNFTQRNYNSLNIVDGVAYNNPDYGNFLWGQGGKQLGFSYGTLRGASHLNNAFNSRSDNPGKPYSVLDSPGDQRAIKNGYNYWLRKPKGSHR